MTSLQQADVALGIFPYPRQVSYVEGSTELSADVRLATSDVLPFIRKTIRSGLSAAGIRVVANKKQFVVSINVVDVETLNLDDVPETGRGNYYELSLIDNMIEIRTHSQLGAMWGAQTLAAVFRAFGHGAEIPNLRIRDWSENDWRGFFVDTCWGIERMAPDQWTALMERLLRNKMNVFGLNLCGSVPDPGSGRIIDMLLLGWPDNQEMVTEIELEWYSPSAGKWQREKVVPRIFADEMVRSIATTAHEKGLRLVPGLDLVSFSRLLAKVKGKSSVMALADPELRTALEGFCGQIAEVCSRDEKVPLVISFGPLSRPADNHLFYGETPYELEEFLVWFIEKVIIEKFSATVLSCDFLFGQPDRISARFLERLQELDLARQVWLKWDREPSATTMDETIPDQLSNWPGGQWLAPNLCNDNWARYQSRVELLQKPCWQLSQKQDCHGVLASGAFDSAYLDHIQFLAQLCWNPGHENTIEQTLAHGALIYGKHAKAYRSGAELLGQAVALPAVTTCFLPSFPGQAAMISEYPRSALQELGERDRQQVIRELNKGLELARSAVDELKPIAESPKEELDIFLAKSAGSLLAEATRVAGLANCFLILLSNPIEADQPGLPEKIGKLAFEPLRTAMELIEQHKPKALVPATLASFNRLLHFLDIKI